MNPFAENTALRARVAALEEELALWKSYADDGGAPSLADFDEVERVRGRLVAGGGASRREVRPAAVRMLLALMAAGGAMQTRMRLLELLTRRADGSTAEIKVVDVYVAFLRKALRAHGVGDAIETVWGQGYVLRGAGRAAVAKLIGPSA